MKITAVFIAVVQWGKSDDEHTDRNEIYIDRLGRSEIFLAQERVRAAPS